MRQGMNERTNESVRALLFMISVQRWRCWLGREWFCQYHYFTKMCKRKSQEPIHAFCLHNPTERKSDKKKRSSLLPSQPSNLPSIPSLSLPKKRSDPMPHPDRNRPSPPRDRRRRWHRAAVINLPILPPEPTFQERIYAAFQQVGRLGRFVGVDVLVGVPVLGGFSWSCLCYVS